MSDQEEEFYRFVKMYLSDYEMSTEEGDYLPSRKEFFLINNCVQGLLIDLEIQGYLTINRKTITPK